MTDSKGNRVHKDSLEFRVLTDLKVSKEYKGILVNKDFQGVLRGSKVLSCHSLIRYI
jgi:hypothetical protein